MTRIGPNQDINDPTSIIKLTKCFQTQSDLIGQFIAQSQMENPFFSGGSPITDVSIPFKRRNGTTTLINGSGIELDDYGNYIYDYAIVSDSILVTYIDLAERFRIYWTELNDALDQLDDFNYRQSIEDFSPYESEPYWLPAQPSGDGYWVMDGSLGGASYSGWLVHYYPDKQSEPIWSGNGPINYNEFTYPQLEQELTRISASGILDPVSESWNEIYWYRKAYTTYLSQYVKKSSASFGNDHGAMQLLLDPPLPLQDSLDGYIQIYNYESTSKNILISMNLSVGLFPFQEFLVATCASIAEIRDINCYPSGSYKLQPTYVRNSFEASIRNNWLASGVASATKYRIVNIPSQKSAFIYIQGAIFTISSIPLYQVANNISLSIDDKSLSFSPYT